MAQHSSVNARVQLKIRGRGKTDYEKISVFLIIMGAICIFSSLAVFALRLETNVGFIIIIAITGLALLAVGSYLNKRNSNSQSIR